jgi:hypothetical protein
MFALANSPFLKEKISLYDHQSVCLSACLPFLLLNQPTNFNKIWYERYRNKVITSTSNNNNNNNNLPHLPLVQHGNL